MDAEDISPGFDSVELLVLRRSLKTKEGRARGLRRRRKFNLPIDSTRPQ